MEKKGNPQKSDWHEVLDSDGEPRFNYGDLLGQLERSSRSDLKELEERLDATLRELGVTFELPNEYHRNTWFCDLLPQIFTSDEWTVIVRGFQQRIEAFDLFLKDVYGEREILRQGVIPTPVVLGSPNYQRSAVGLESIHSHYLCLSGMSIARDPEGRFMVKQHYFSHASGLSYMVQNRRLLARVLPELFHSQPVESIADVPTDILMRLRSLSPRLDASVVLLTPGTGSAVYSEHGFLARRMGIPLVEGGDLVVLDDRLFLRTVSGLEQVDVVYTRLADPWIDPLVFNSKSRIGIPGLVQCVRKKTVSIVNRIGSQLADDRSFLHFSNTIIRFYLGVSPILPSLQTYWLGDLDQREMVLEQPNDFQIRTLTGERFNQYNGDDKAWNEVRNEIRRAPNLYVAQPIDDCSKTLCISGARRSNRRQDHIVYGIRDNDHFEVFPGALTRVSATETGRTESTHGGGGKDTWVLQSSDLYLPPIEIFTRPRILPARPVTGRVASGFYWLGRYLERAMSVAKMIQVIETIEMEELTVAERKLYRPVWNRLLPPLENSNRRGGRSITTPAERYRLMIDPGEYGSVLSMVNRSLNNAHSLREAISPEAWVPLTALRSSFVRTRFRPLSNDADARRITRRLSETAIALIPQFFAIAQQTMLADDGWRFSELGEFVERAVTTGNATYRISQSIVKRIGTMHSIEIELSAFLRLLSSRDAYRRIYQTRAEPPQVLEFLWQNPEMPRSVAYSLGRCADLLRASLPASSSTAEHAQTFLDTLLRKIRRIDWYSFFVSHEESKISLLHHEELLDLLSNLMDETQELHNVITDNFLSHQSIIAAPEPTLF